MTVQTCFSPSVYLSLIHLKSCRRYLLKIPKGRSWWCCLDSSPVFSLCITALHLTTEVNVENNLAVAPPAIWCSVCVCVTVCVCVLVFLDVDGRLGRAVHKRSSSARVGLEGICTQWHRERY